MKQPRSVLTVVTVTAMAAALAGCSSATAASSGTTTITWWNAYTGSDRPAVEKVVENFNASQSKYKVDMTIEPGDTLSNKLLPSYASGNGPTIATVGFSALPGYASKGVLKNVEDYYSGWSGSSALKEADVASGKYDGVQYGVPMTGSTTMLFYNKTLLSKAGLQPPTTLTELASEAVKLTKYHSAKPTSSTYGIALPDNNALPTWEAFMQANGGGVLAADGKSSLLGSAASISTITTWTDLLKNDHAGPTDLAGAASDALFEAGRVAFNVTGPWASAGYKAAGIDFGVVSVPAGTVTRAATLNADDFVTNAKATTQQVQAAYAFMQYWDSTKSQLIYSLQSGVPPVNTSITAAQLASNPTAVEFLAAEGATEQYDGQLNYAEMENNVFVPTLQKIENGQASAANALPAAAKQIDALIK